MMKTDHIDEVVANDDHLTIMDTDQVLWVEEASEDDLVVGEEASEDEEQVTGGKVL